MYHKVPGATPIEVESLPMWIPPPPKDKTKILFHQYPTKDQYWRREELPDFYYELRPAERMRQLEEEHLVDQGKLEKVTYYNPVLEQYRRLQWEHRINGVHMFVNGEVIYLTGPHWWYLQWCQFDHKENNGYPLFYKSQVPRFYFRKYCKEDPLSLGYIIIGARGFGKTSEETGEILESLTKAPRRQKAALQSKSEDDAKDVIFLGKFVPVFKSLPDFFKPEFDHGSNPLTKLNFFREAKRGTKARDVKYGPEYELENTIFFVSAKEKALDGATLTEVFNDEVGKTNPKKEADVKKRMQVNRFCVYRNDRKIGLIRATSTVEEMDEGGDECYAIWKESDQRRRTENGLTKTGLYQMFVSCLDTSTKFADKYGNIDKDAAYKWHMNERDSRRHDLQDLSSWMRKNPMNSTEAFIKDASKSVFNVFILNNRLEELKAMKRLPYLVGNLYYPSGVIDTEVDFKEDPHAGRFYVGKLLDVDQVYEDQRKLANNISYYKDSEGKKIWQPRNNRLFRIGNDPIKYSKTKDPRASKASFYVYELYNGAVDTGKAMKDWETANWILEYIERPVDPATTYEDLIMAIRYFGCSVLIESNIKEVVKHLVDRGYGDCIIFKHNYSPEEDFIQNTRTDDGGISSVKEVIHSYVTRLISQINKHGHRIKFPRLIQSLLEFEPENTTMHDAAVAAGYALLAAEANIAESQDLHDINEWFDEFDQSGRRGVLIPEEEHLDNYDGEHITDAF